MKWTNAKVIELIDLFHERPVLWDRKNKNYKDRNMKQDALMEIAISIDRPKDKIESKLKNLVRQFGREMKREEMSKKSGSGTNNIFKSKWFAFKSMTFLKDRNTPRRTINTENEGNIWEEQANLNIPEESVLDDQIFETPEQSSENISTRFLQHVGTREPSRTHEVNEAYAIMKHIWESRVQKDEYSLFGEQVAIKLRKLPTAYARCRVQHILQTTLFEAEMGKYNNPPSIQNLGIPLYRAPSTHSIIRNPPRPMSVATEPRSGRNEEETSSSFNYSLSDI